MADDATVLVVDDLPANLKLMRAVLAPHGFTVLSASSGEQALEVLEETLPDVVLLDVLMPGLDGYETCRRIRSSPVTSFLPIVMVTASGERERLKAIEVGADDFITKPFDQAELLARVRSLVRIKRFHDTITAQAAELTAQAAVLTAQAAELKAWNDELAARVDAQVAELERLDRLRRFLSPQVAQVILASGDEGFLRSHRREITTVFTDLRGFTSFAETTEPEETMAVLADYHRVLGELVFAYEGTLEHFEGDGLMVFFNDPVPCDNAADRAVSMAVAMRAAVAQLADAWRRRGHSLGFGVGIAQGYATLGRVGFEGRYDYAAIGTVTNLAARLCGESGDGQILVTPRVLSAVTIPVESRTVGPLDLKGFSRQMDAFEVVDAQQLDLEQMGVPL